MDNRHRTFWVLFVSLAIVLFLIVYLNFGSVKNFISGAISSYGYPAVFLIVYIIDLFEGPLNPESIGTFALIIGLNAFIVIPIVVAADFIGCLTSFYVGHRHLHTKVKMSCSKKNHANYCNFFYKYGKWALLVAMLTPLPNILFVWLAGSFRMGLKDFLIFGSVPSAIRIGLLLMLVSGIVSLF